MTDTLTAKEIKKRILEAEKATEIREAGNNRQKIGEIEAKYYWKKQAIDSIAEPENQQTQKPPLFKKSTRYEELWKLEQLFREVNQETYPRIATKIGIIDNISKYRTNQRGRNIIKEHILNIKETFNKRSIKLWKRKLKATRRKDYDGLQLVPAN